VNVSEYMTGGCKQSTFSLWSWADAAL